MRSLATNSSPQVSNSRDQIKGTYYDGIKSRFLTMCDNLIEECNKPLVALPEIKIDLDLTNRSPRKRSVFERAFVEVLKEDGLEYNRQKSYFRTDRLGKKIEIKPNCRFYLSKNGVGISVAKGDRVVHDDNDQAYAVPKGARTTKNRDGTLTIRKKDEGFSKRSTIEGSV